MSLLDLWLPILLSGVATHIASTLAWTVLPHHKPELRGVNCEDEFLNWLQGHGVTAGQYLFPFTHDMKEAETKEFKAKQATCTGMLTVWEKPIHMPAAIAKTLTFFLVAALTIGYLASIAFEPGAAFLDVFRFVTTAGVAAHCFARFPHVFWFQTKLAMLLLDGVVYAVLTGLIFAALWPGVPAS